MPDWIWIAVSAALFLLLIYSWTRSPADADLADDATPEDDAADDTETSSAEPAASAAPVEKAREVLTTPSATTSTKTPESVEPKVEAKPVAAKPAAAKTESIAVIPRFDAEEDEAVDPTRVGIRGKRPFLQPPTKKILFDADIEPDEPTQAGALIVLSATAQTDRGLKRKRNEDSLLALSAHEVFVVADGMGGYRGGEVASALAVKTIEEAFVANRFEGEQHDGLPGRASELARAIQMANAAILERAAEQRELEGMGTTICAAQFVPKKARLYVGHVGDSRMYRVRQNKLAQMTSDHTMRDLGVTGPEAGHLSRAVGVWPTVAIDVIIAEPCPGDVYILCSDGLTKMVSDEEIAQIATSSESPSTIVDGLISTANAHGGKDNVTVIVVRVIAPPKT